MLTLENAFHRVNGYGDRQSIPYCGQTIHAGLKGEGPLFRPVAQWALKTAHGGVPFAMASYYCQSCAERKVLELNTRAAASRAEVEELYAELAPGSAEVASLQHLPAVRFDPLLSRRPYPADLEGVDHD